MVMRFPKWQWFRSADFIVLTCILVGLGLGGVAFGEFVLYAFRANLALNSLIVGALLFGSYLIYDQCFKLFRERYAVRWWFEYLNEHFTLAVDRPRFMQRCVVNDMLLRVERVNSDAGDTLSTDMIEKEAERIAHRIERNQELCRFMVGLMVALGLLGTFVGLLETLVQVSQLVGSIGEGISSSSNAEISMANVILGLKNPMSAMGTAFSASMFGLIGSIALGLQMVRLGMATSHTHTDIRAYSLQAMELVLKHQPRPPPLEDLLKQYLVELGEQGRQISKSLGVVALLSETTLPKLGDMNLHMQDTANHSQQFVQALSQATAALRDFGALGELLRDMAANMRATAAHTSAVGTAVELLRTDQQQMTALTGDLQTSVTKAVEQLHFDLASLRSDLQEGLDGLEGARSEERMYTEDAKAQAQAAAAAQARALEYMAGFAQHISAVPGMVRDLRLVVAELPRRDEALASFATAVERFGNQRMAG